MFVERPELSEFSAAWKSKAPTQVAEELASYSLETKRIPDPYYFSLDQDGDLFSPSAQLKVKRIINTTSRVGQLEAQAFDSISRWARNEESGAIAWISPPFPGVYSVSKVIISEIEIANGVKRILNRAIVLDIDENECLDLGQKLSGYSTNRPFLAHLDQLRSTAIIMDTKERSWIEVMEEIIPDQDPWDSVRRGDEMRAKQEALAEAEKIFKHYPSTYTAAVSYDDENMQRAIHGMLGDKQGSCPVRLVSALSGQTAFQIFSENSLTIGGVITSKDPDFCISCPACEAEIRCVVKTGGSCPRCGAVKRCG